MDSTPHSFDVFCLPWFFSSISSFSFYLLLSFFLFCPLFLPNRSNWLECILIDFLYAPFSLFSFFLFTAAHLSVSFIFLAIMVRNSGKSMVPLPSASTSLIMSCSSASVGFCPRDLITWTTNVEHIKYWHILFNILSKILPLTERNH